MEKNEIIIKAENLTKIYVSEGGTETQALRGVSFKINRGEFVSIMGPSGSGKSTLLHILGFLDKHTDGIYEFNGKTINELSEEEVAQIRNEEMGFVFQAYNLLPRATVLENVKLPLLYSEKDESTWNKLALEAIEAVGLTHRKNHLSSQLSGGEKQRVAIARALINDPPIIFADEPTGNLDSNSGKAIMEILQFLNESHGHTIVLITHETYTAEHAKRIIRVKDGLIESDEFVKNHRKASDKNDFLK